MPLLAACCCSVRPRSQGGKEVGGGQLISCYRVLVVEHPQPHIVMNALIDNVSGPACACCLACTGAWQLQPGTGLNTPSTRRLHSCTWNPAMACISYNLRTKAQCSEPV